MSDNKSNIGCASSDKLKCGQLNVSVQNEETVWTDRTRVTVFSLPWSFTKYSLTPSRLLIEKGFLSKKEDEIRLYRIRDVSVSESLYERLTGTGTIKLISSDSSLPNLTVKRIKNVKNVKNVLSQYIENSRRENGVRTSELVGDMCHSDHPHDSLGPEIFPDINQNGIDDRTE